MNTNTISETADMLRKLELIEKPTRSNQTVRCNEYPRREEVRGIQYQQNPARENYYRRPRRNNYTAERENEISNARRSMPASQITATERSLEKGRATSPRRNDQQHSGN
jgi:hypothetical protein